MAHLAYVGSGIWTRVEPAHSLDCVIIEWNVTPVVGDTFSEFTSRPNGIGDIQRRHGLKACVQRTAMWGERDFEIVEG